MLSSIELENTQPEFLQFGGKKRGPKKGSKKSKRGKPTRRKSRKAKKSRKARKSRKH